MSKRTLQFYLFHFLARWTCRMLQLFCCGQRFMVNVFGLRIAILPGNCIRVGLRIDPCPSFVFGALGFFRFGGLRLVLTCRTRHSRWVWLGLFQRLGSSMIGGAPLDQD